MLLYRIANWDSHFENNRTRELKGMSWVPIPNKMDGDGYTELLEHVDGAAHYGAWVAIVLVASKCDPRGTLLRSTGTPHDPVTLSRISRLPPEVFESALPRLVQIGWVTAEEIGTEPVREIAQQVAEAPQEPAIASQESAPYRNGPERTGTERPERKNPEGPEGENRTRLRRRSGESGIFKNVDLGVLRDGRKLLAWYMTAVGSRSPPFEDTPLNRLNVFAAAQRALEVGKNPPALFTTIVGKRDWKLLSNEQEKRAEAVLKTLNGELPRTSNLAVDEIDAATESAEKSREDQIRRAKELLKQRQEK